MRVTAGDVRMNSKAMFFSEFLHMDTPVFVNQQKLILISANMEALLRTYQEKWPKGMDDRRESKESVLLVCFDNDMPFIKMLVYLFCQKIDTNISVI